MSSTLLVDLDWQAGTLQRLIGTIERRGFEVLRMELCACGFSRQVEIELQPIDDRRDFAVLCRQIDRLYGLSRHESESPKLSYGHRFPLVS